MGIRDWFFSTEDGSREVWVKVCPKCHSADVTSRGAISNKALSPNWVCQNCGFVGGSFPEFLLDDAKKITLPDDKSERRFIPSRMPLFADYPKKPSETNTRLLWIGLIVLLLWLMLH